MIFILAIALAGTVLANDDLSLIAEGQHIYRTATRPDGTAVQALVQNDVPLPPAAAACVNCHRRSGYGVSEGGSRSLNLTKMALFSATDKPPIRPAYTDETLARAIIAGVTPDGRQMEETMPLYELTRRDERGLSAYLRTLGSASPVGLDDNQISIATVVSEHAPIEEREAVIQVLQKYVELKNNESRRDTERAAASNRQYYGRVKQRAYRTWNLNVWTLAGPESTWPEQLESRYAEDEPFVIVSGTAGPNWLPVHQFCEDREIPCLLPVSDSPTDADNDFYSLYYSAGAMLEARTIAEQISTYRPPEDAQVLVVHKNDALSLRAVEELRSELEGYDVVAVAATSGKSAMTARKWRKLLRSKKPDVLIAWLPEDAVTRIFDPSLDKDLLPASIYTSNAFTSWSDEGRHTTIPSDSVMHVYPYSLPTSGLAQFPREHLWLKQRGLSDLDPVAAVKALYACRVLGLGLARIQSNFSRDYLLEVLEHALDGTEISSLFPHTSLGPNQRLLSRGAYIVDPTQLRDGDVSHSPWIQP